MRLISEKHLPWIEIHAATLLFGLAGLFGKFIDLPALWIVFGRVLFAFIALALVIRLKHISFKLASKRDVVIVMILGAVLALHWFAFFHSIQISTVAIGLLSFASFPIFVTFMEPYFFKERLHLKDLLTALVTFTGVALVIPNFDIQNNIVQGVFWGLISGFTFAIISLINRKYVQSYSGSLMAFYQDFFACIFIVPFIFMSPIIIRMPDWGLLLLLGVVFTALAHTLFIRSMKNIKAQQASIIVSLEPVYGIIFAVILLSEIPSLRTVIGGILILGAAFYTTRKN